LHLNSDLLGQRVRCPESACRKVFVVREAPTAPRQNGAEKPPVADGHGDGAIPVPANNDRPARRRKRAAIEEMDWQLAPPPVQTTGATAAAAAEPPPARERAAPVALGQRAREWEQRPRRFFRRFLMLGLFGIFVCGAGYLVHFLSEANVRDEITRQADAEKDLQAASYRAAAKKYHELAGKFGRSPRAAEYQFLAELCDLRDATDRMPPDPAAALTQGKEFEKHYGPRLHLFTEQPKRRQIVADGLATVASGFADLAEAAAKSPGGETALPPLLATAKEAQRLLTEYGGHAEQVQARLDNAMDTLIKTTTRRRSVATVLAALKAPRPDVNAVRRQAQRLQVADDPDVTKAIERAERVLVGTVAYEAIAGPPHKDGPPDGPPSLLLETAPTTAHQPGEVVLALARGVLFALDGGDGRRLWACRVGLDAGDLQARVPAVGDGPELILVATTTPPGLTARAARTGAVVWHQPLDAPALGRPVQEAGRLFVPTAGPDGFVYDLDTRTGLMHGRFVTHQQLSGGAAFDPATRRLYVPAHGQGVFVFNFEAEGPRCDGLLRTGHPAGSLRGEPIVVSGEEGVEVARYLVLSQEDGLAAMKLRAFRLLADPTNSPAKAEVRLPGWSWFSPYHDPETIAVVTDAGAIGLFGIQQKGDDDPPLFPLLGQMVTAEVRSVKPARGQLVHASESGFWVLADGVLKHWRLGLSRQSGRQLVPAWGDGVRLGAPLHAAQVSADRRAFHLVTQSDAPPTMRATAVDALSGQVIWQRPLGMAPQGDPLDLGGTIVVLDQSGGLYRFDPNRHLPGSADPWQTGGVEIAKPVMDLVGAPHLLSAADGHSAWAVMVRLEGDGYHVLLRHVAGDGTATEGSAALPAPPAGRPALGPSAVVLPLTDGQLCRITLDAAPRAVVGPTWRSPGARSDARGHVVHWKDEEFLVSDGSRGLRRLVWPADGNYEMDMQTSVELSQRAIGSIARLTGGGVAVADAGGTVTLLRGDRPTPARRWQVGPVTAGPWTVGDQIAVVVDRRKLVRLNPDADTAVWTYTTAGDGIETPPRLVDGAWVVADVSGRFVALDPATGKPLGAGFQVAAEAAPASAVAAFGPGRLFAPLTDGTVLLLPLSDLKK
jgi:outer membrane protein assembly factor BamB